MPAVPAFAPAHARDRAAAEAFAEADLPTSDEEVWRYSRVGDVDLHRYAPALEPGSTEVPECAEGTFAALEGAASLGIATVDGHVVHTRPLGGRGGDGILGDDVPERPEPEDAFALLNDAFAAPVVLRVPPGAFIDPIVVVHWISAAGTAAFPRVVLDAGADCDVTLLEVFRSVEGGDVLVVPGSDLVAGKAARVNHLVLQHLDRAAWQLGTQRSTVDADATLTVTTAGFGGAYARVRTDCRLVGRGATGNLHAVWFGEDDQHLDFRTFQDHAAPDTTSDLVYKGAVGGRSRSVYTGLIKVRPNARGTNAVQTNRNLKLSDDAWAESVPNLEIENNDVRCAHASAVGPVDEEQRWYLESRGVPTPVAERLIVAGFFEDVIGSIPVAAFAGALRQLVAEKLEHLELGGVIDLCALEEIEPGTARRFDVGQLSIAVVRIDDDVYAVGDRCTHQDISLAEGEVDAVERTIECWKHGSQFDLRTGEPLSLPATKPTPVYDVDVIDGRVVLKEPS